MAPEHPGGGEAPAPTKAAIAHIPALDGLRGAAVAGVLVFHLGFLPGGYLGVDLFFVLSGFLITSLLLAEHGAAGRIDLRDFWGRRARRLLPALWLLLMGIAAYAAVVARPVDLSAIRADALATVAYLANWHAIADGGSYWDISMAPSPLQHTWSLAIEEQFYVVWPLLFVLMVTQARRTHRDAAQIVLRVAAVGAAASAAGLVLLHRSGASDTRVYEGTDTRAAALLLGVALAAWRARSARPSTSSSSSTSPSLLGRTSRRADHLLEATGVASALVLGLLWIGLDGRSPWLYRGGLALASVLAMVVVAAASRPSSTVVGRTFSMTPLRWLGAISYGLYLWHWPVYQGLDALNGRFPGLGPRHLTGGELVAAKLGLSLAIALVSYHLLEQPIRRGAIPPRWRPAAFGAGVVTAGAAVFLATLGGIPARTIEAPSGQRLAHVEGGPVVVVAGDSVALSVASRWYADPVRYGLNPVDHTRIGCSFAATGHPTQSFTGEPIRPASCQQYALDGLGELDPDIVYLVVGSRPNDSIQLDGRWVQACDPAFDENYRTSAIDLLHDLRATGAQVVVGTVLHSGAASLPVAGSEERIDCVNRVIASLPSAVAGVHVVDGNELLCPGPGPCVEELDGGPVRSDGLHFDQGPGGDRVAEWIAARTLDAAGPGTGRGTDKTDPMDPTDPVEPTTTRPPAPTELARPNPPVPPRTLDWLRRMSTQAIGRDMDAAGSRFWAERLVAGAPRVEVTRSVVDSNAWRRHRVGEAYRTWLHREPDAAQLDRWSTWLERHGTSELDIHLATTDEGAAAAGSTDRDRASHLATALDLPAAAQEHFERLLAEGTPWADVVRSGYFSLPASDRRIAAMAPRSSYTPPQEALIEEFRTSGDERTPLTRALATLA